MLFNKRTFQPKDLLLLVKYRIYMNMEMKVQYRVLKRTDVLLRTFEGIAWSSIQCQKGAKFAVHEGNRGPRRLLQGHLYQNGKKKKCSVFYKGTAEHW